MVQLYIPFKTEEAGQGAPVVWSVNSPRSSLWLCWAACKDPGAAGSRRSATGWVSPADRAALHFEPETSLTHILAFLNEPETTPICIYTKQARGKVRIQVFFVLFVLYSSEKFTGHSLVSSFSRLLDVFPRLLQPKKGEILQYMTSIFYSTDQQVLRQSYLVVSASSACSRKA